MWRSTLFVPVLEERFLAKASTRQADAIVLDLEASIAAGRKAEARAALPSAIERLCAQNQDVMVRINMLWRPALHDIEYAVQAGVKAIVIPGCESRSQIEAVDAVVGELEAEKGLPNSQICLIPIIESSRGVRDADTVLRASDRIACAAFGIEDYLSDMSACPSTELLTMTSLSLAEAARAASVIPLVIPESLANLSDLDAFEAAARRGRQMGSEGGFAVHPGQVERLNRVFTPAPEELEIAKRIIATAREAEAAGKGAARLDGRMIDLPIIIRAKRLLDRGKRLGLLSTE